MKYTKNKIENENNERAVLIANFVALSFSRGLCKYMLVAKIAGIIDIIDINQKLIYWEYQPNIVKIK